MSYLSANTLLHFTPQIEFLFSILEKGFIPRYSREIDLSGHRDNPPVYYPMVCFCDIPLSEVTVHQKIYGQYGIGMKKEWAIQKGINPVFYLNPESTFNKRLGQIQRDAMNAVSELFQLSINGFYKEEIDSNNNKQHRLTAGVNAENVEQKSKVYFKALEKITELYSLFNYFKPYRGNYMRNNEDTLQDYIYYDEKEWRYIPTKIISDEVHYLTSYKLTTHKELAAFGGELSNEYKNELNENIEKNGQQYFLYFDPSEIKYLIVKNDDEVIKLIDKFTQLQIIFPEKYTTERIKVLSAKIITCEQITEDF